MKVICCDCNKEYDGVLYQVEGISVPVMECPHCGLQHIVEFTVIPRQISKEKIGKIKLTTSYYPNPGGSRILDITGTTDYSLADDLAVNEWDTTDEFILAFNINSGAKDTVASTWRVYWQDDTDTSGYTALAATGELNYTISDSSWNDGDVLATGDFVCDAVDPSQQAGTKTKNVNTSDSINLADDTDSELWFGINCSGADTDHIYSFQAYCVAEGAVAGTLGVTLRIAPASQAELYARTDIWTVPTSTGNQTYTISGETGTPFAALITMIGTDGTDSFDNHSDLSIGFTDGTTSETNGFYCADGVTTTSNWYFGDSDGQNNYCISTANPNIIANATFSSWQTGGMTITWAGAGIASTHHQIQITYFFGTNAKVYIEEVNVAPKRVNMSFTPRLIFGFCRHSGSYGYNENQDFSYAVATNGSNGLTQGCIDAHWSSGVSTSALEARLGVGTIGAQQASVEYAISQINSSGFYLDGDGDFYYVMCIGNISNDVDSGYASIPTSGSIAVTDPGFTPAFVGTLLSTNTAANTLQTTIQYGVDGFGMYDGTNENSITRAGEDNVSTTNHTSVHSSKIIHAEDPDQSDIYESNAITTDSSGFDVTMTTYPSTATYFHWWVIEKLFDVSVEETATIQDRCDASLNVASDYQSFRFPLPRTTGNHTLKVPGWTTTPKAAIVTVVNVAGGNGYEGDENRVCIGMVASSTSGCAGYAGKTAATSSIRWFKSPSLIYIRNNLGTYLYSGSFTSFASGGITIYFAGSPQLYDHEIHIQFFAGSSLSADAVRFSPGDHVTSLSFQPNLIFVTGTNSSNSFSTDGHLTFGVLTDGTNGLTQNHSTIAEQNGQTTTNSYKYLGTGHSAAEFIVTTGGFNYQTALSNLDSSGFNADDSDSDELIALCLNVPGDVDSGYSTIPTSGNISVTDPGFTPEVLGVVLTDVTTLDTAQQVDVIMGLGAVTDADQASLTVAHEDNTSGASAFAFANNNIIYTRDIDLNVKAQGAFNQFTANGFDITMSTNPATATYYIWWTIEGYSGAQSATCAETATINEASTATQTSSSSGSESATINDAPTASQTSSSAGSESATINDASTAVSVFNATCAETVTINEAETVSQISSSIGSESATIDDISTVQVDFNASDSESATIDEAQTGALGEQTATGAETATISEAETVIKTMVAACEETATINEVETVQASVQSVGSETATINEVETVQVAFAVTDAETGTINETQTADETNAGTVLETATINESATAQHSVQNVSITETATINETSSAVQEQSSTGSESATIDEAETTQVDFNGSDSESATINEEQTVQAVNNVSIAETATINEAQTTEELNEGTTAESATIDETETVQAILNDTVSESVTVNDAPTASQVQTSVVSETATINEAETAQVAFQVSDSESASIDETETVQSNYQVSVAETAAINEAQISDETNASTQEETATINESATAQHAVQNISTAESATIDDSVSASKTQTETVSESATIDEAETVQANLQTTASETATIDEAQTVQANLQASVSESATINEAQTTEEENAAASSETVSINEEQTVQATLSGSVSESATINEVQATEEENAATGAETVTINEVETVSQVSSRTISESATIDETETTQTVFNVSIAESATINEAQTSTEANEGAGVESATIDETSTVQANLNSTEDESSTINEASTTQQTSTVDNAESADIDESITAQQTSPVADTETVSIDETNSAVRTLVASVLESLSIDDTTDSDLQAVSESTLETADVDDSPAVQAVYYVDITESVAISAAVEGIDYENLFNDVYINGVVKGYTIQGIVQGYTITG